MTVLFITQLLVLIVLVKEGTNNMGAGRSFAAKSIISFRLYLLCGLLACTSALGAEPERVAQARSLNNSLLQLHEAVRNAGTSEAAALRARAAAVIERRAAHLSALIEENPAAALSMAFPPELLADLAGKFPDSAGRLESYGTWQGLIEYWIEDSADLKSSRSLIRMRSGADRIDLHFAGRVPSIRSGDLLQAVGLKLGSAVVAETGNVQTLAAATSTTTGPACSATGVQNTAVLLATFPGVTPPATVTPQSIYDNFFGTGHSLDGYWRETSYGATSASGDVLGWYTLSSAYTCSTMDRARDEAIAIASAAGVNFQKYNRIFVIYPKIGCTAGFAYVGCFPLSTPSGTINASTSYIEADYMTGDQAVSFAAHEGGHNLGLNHAGTLSFGTEALGPLTSTGTVSEFADDFSVMGSQTLGQYSAQHKAEILGWLANGPNYHVVQTTGTWTLQPFETNTAGLEALKIQRGTGNNDWLWLEYREPLGTYDSTVYFQQPSGGAFIHYEDPTVGDYTHLLNFQPQTGSWYAPALVAGQTWADPYTNLSISVESATPTAMTVKVTYGSTPCTPSNPTVKLSPSNLSASPGNAVTYSLTVTNSDSSACSASTFTMGSTQPDGWPTAFSTATLTLAPGQSSSATLTKNVPASAPVGTYVVDSSATAAAEVGSGSANVTVTAPILAATVSTPASTYTAGQTVPLTALVSYGGGAASGASVIFTVTQPNGAKSTKTVTADSSGKAVWNYKIGPKGPPGSYSFAAAATYSSQTASGAGSFTVQ
jgi:M6 family metalloprotease-like protein